MDFDQLIKRMDWLDEQQRKYISVLEESREKIKLLENENKVLKKKVKDFSSLVTNIETTSGRVDEFNVALTRHRKEINKVLDDYEKKQETRVVEFDKRVHVEIAALEKSFDEIRKTKDAIAELKRSMGGLGDEENRRNKTIAALQSKMDDLVRVVDGISNTVASSDEKRRQDVKMINDVQGEVVAVKKRLDEIKEKGEINSDNLRRIDIKIGELHASEAERKQAQLALVENQNLYKLEREREWKEWQSQIDSIGKQTEIIESQLQNWETAQRAVKRAQETYEEITTKFERRINEITEIQRLGEDRFRQEWITFKADDQKRWTSFTLGQDETRKDIQAEISKITNRITTVEDLAQTIQDIIQQSRDAEEQMLQAILSQVHELLSAYERIKGTG